MKKNQFMFLVCILSLIGENTCTCYPLQWLWWGLAVFGFVMAMLNGLFKEFSA